MSEAQTSAAPAATSTPVNNATPAIDTKAPQTQSETSSEEVDPSELAAEEADLADLSKKEQKELAKNLKKKFKFKVDGNDIEEEIDLGNEEELTKRFQMGKAAQKRMQESAELRKAAEEFISMLRTNPRKVLSDPNLGVDLKKIAQEFLQEEIDNAGKTPQQLELEAAKKELQEIRDKAAQDEKQRKEQEFARLQSQHEERIQVDIEGALKNSDIPKTPYTVRKMAEMMIIALNNNIELSPTDLVPLLRQQMTSDIKEMFAASSDDVLEELIGKDNITRMRKRNLAKAKQKIETANQVKTTSSSTQKKEAPKEAKKLTIKEFLKA